MLFHQASLCLQELCVFCHLIHGHWELVWECSELLVFKLHDSMCADMFSMYPALVFKFQARHALCVVKLSCVIYADQARDFDQFYPAGIALAGDKHTVMDSFDRCKIFVGGLRRSLIKWEVQDALEALRIPKPKEIYMVRPKSDASAQVCFLQYDDEQTAEVARYVLEGCTDSRLTDTTTQAFAL